MESVLPTCTGPRDETRIIRLACRCPAAWGPATVSAVSQNASHVAALLGDSWLVHTGRMNRSSPTNAAGVSVKDWHACRRGLWRGLDADLLDSSGLQPPRTPWQGPAHPALPLASFPSLPFRLPPPSPFMFPRMVTQIIHLHSNVSLGSATLDNCYECCL